MGDEKYHYDNLPIPTYEEATSSRPHSSQSGLGPEEIGDDAERQGLLHHASRHDQTLRGYHPPTVESARSSLDLLPSPSLRDSEDAVREEMEQMEVEDSNSNDAQPLIGDRISKRLSSFTQSLSSLHLPFRQYLPNIRFPSIRLGRFAESDAQSTARFMIFGRLFGIFLIVSVIYILIASGVLQMGRKGQSVYADPELLRVFVQSHMNEHDHIQEYLKFLTEYPHISGLERNFVLAEWMEEEFKTAGLIDVSLERFDVYLNYPKEGGRKVSIVDPPEKRWDAVVEEELAYTDPIREQPYVFHGYSKTGDVTGRLIYANYGSRDDFRRLDEAGISVDGSIALVRYGGTETDRALKVKAAELAGAVGCIIYSDPAEDGFVQGPVWPDGRYRPDDSAQRGTVGLTSYVAGDPLSPGWASTPGDKHRISAEDSPALVNIPSIPLAWRDAQQLLRSIQGFGKQFEGEYDWNGGIPDVGYWTGNGSSPMVNLVNDQYEETYKPIHNVLGAIPGWEQPNKKIVVGNHRDAWCFGAVDPSSGTAIMLEVIRIFGDLMKIGWRPLRTIEFASWDAEEYNLVGSTEHVENRIEELRLNGVAYVNVDVGVVGPTFSASGSPVFERLLHQVMKRTADPYQNKTLWELWDTQGKQLGGLGAGSDYLAFQDFAGTSSLDISFEGEPFPYHSCYDNFEWMQKYGDPGFAYHKLMGEVLALLILELSNKPILPFDMEDYANWVHRWVDALSQKAKIHSRNSDDSSNRQDELPHETNEETFTVAPLQDAAEIFSEQARQFHRWDQEWAAMYYGSGEFESNVLAIKRMSHNNRMANFETHLLDLEEGGGLPNRTQYKHVIQAPQLWSGYDGAHFPGVTDAIDAGDWRLAQAQVDRAAGILTHAARKLIH